MTISQARATNGADDWPRNNLLRRLNADDYALVAPYLAEEESRSNTLLYNPGDDVDTVHFPCGASLVSYLVANEDGRDVETILVGREGAVGGIVSLGYLPAFTLASAMRRMFDPPLLIGSLMLIAGYVHGYVKRLPRIAPPEVMWFIRRQQLRRLLMMESAWR